MSDRKRRRAASGVFITALLLLAPIVMTGSALGGMPEFSNVPTDITAEATGPSGAVIDYTNPTAIDPDTMSDLTVTCLPVSGSTFAIGLTTVSCTADDGSGNTNSVDFNVTVQDTTPPVISGVPADITAEATGPSGAVVTYTPPTATDLVDPSPTVSCIPASGSTFPLGDTTVNCTATDASGNHDSATFKVTVQDTTAPDVSIGSKPSNPSNVASPSFGFSSSDGTASFQCKLDSGSYSSCTSPKGYTSLADGSHTFYVEATDPAGNTSSPASYTWTVDTTAPDVSIGSKPSNPSNVASPSFGFSSSDGTASFQCKLDSGSYSSCTSPKGYTSLADGSHTFYVEATDPAGNTSSPASYTWTVDTTAPDVSIGSKPSNPSNVASPSFGFSSSDGTASFQCKLDSGSYSSCTSPKGYTSLADGSHTFYVEATDPAGNTSSPASYTWTVDTTAPDVSIGSKPSNPSNVASPSFGFSSSDGTASFQCKLDSGSYSSCTSPKGYTSLADGSHTFYVEATDPAGNTSTPASYTWTVDTTAPSISIDSQPGLVTNSTTASFTFSSTDPTASFQCSLDGVTYSACASPWVSTLAEGPHTFYVEATDPAGNTSTPASYTWTINTKAPTFSNVPANITAEATGPSGAVVNYTAPTAADDSGSVDVTCTPLSGSTFAIATTTVPYTTVTCSAKADNGTTGSVNFHVTVRDTTPPAFNGTPVQIGASAPSSSGIAVTYTAPTASDLVDGTVSVSCTPASGSTFPVGTTTVTCSATDAHGNTGTVTFKVVVSPPAPIATPSLIVPLSLKAEATSRAGAVVHFVVSSSDNPAPTIVCDHSPGSLFPFGNTKVTCTATGASGGGKTVQSFTVSVRDTTAPVFAGKPSNIVEKVSGKKPLKVVYKQPVATDAVDGKVASVCSPRSGSKFKLGKTTVTCEATDAHKNSSEISFSVNVSALPTRALIAPLGGASLSSPPLLEWTAIAKADYYNVQVFRNGHKVLSTWPRASSFRLKRGWKFAGVKRQLAPGTYTWYVWPGFGSLASANYGRLIGKGTFKIVR